MLINCPECKLQISDKALTCPHCGCPMNINIASQKRRSTRKRMRLPNGFGSITEIKNKKLRKPFRVRVCVGKTSEGKPILKALKPESMFETYNDAYAALVEYNRNPYDLDDDLRVSELYERWTAAYFPTLAGPSSARTITSAWAYCSSIYDMRAKDVRPRHIKGCIEEGYRIGDRGKTKGEKIYASPGVKSSIKTLFNLMLDYACEYELVDKNYSRMFLLSDDVIRDIEANKSAHIIFTEDEIDTLWKNVDTMRYVDMLVIQIYMGWRPQELATLKLEEVNMAERYMIAGMKTDAGKQRIVPIHSKIIHLVERNMKRANEIGSKYLFNDYEPRNNSYGLTYDKYRHRFANIIAELKLNLEHRPHDPRKTFITRCKKANVDEYALKEMVGHTIRDITESVYTVRDVEWLRSDLEKMQ